MYLLFVEIVNAGGYIFTHVDSTKKPVLFIGLAFLWNYTLRRLPLKVNIAWVPFNYLGKYKRNVVPCPTLLSTSIDPLWLLIIF